MVRMAMVASIISLSRFSEPPTSSSEAAPVPVPGDATAASLIVGAAAAQPCGTDNLPTETAPPRSADTAVAPHRRPDLLSPQLPPGLSG
jgi:hypothetical protein